ncbi:enoyl-CoA hydratase/isomerase family protein [Halospeciosus flavus]|uniref:Enoyl-CoA hydratase/isomerase family protein n=1 Tax=Halospeciosus flavus TaxID=3032283 RepID=A0ABD5Z0J1_9EURY|nr:enoyl-CoA hydratase-related protein [Halospeciosus flavus]
MSLADADYETLDVEVGERAERVATVTISRPDARNALNATVRSELKDAVSAAEEDPAVRVLVLTGDDEGGAFVAGADVTEFGDRDQFEQRRVSRRPRVYEMVAEATLPVVARINGHALGGGCELAQACDVRIAKADAKLGQPEINLGLIPGGGGTQRLADLVGEGQALKLILSGELLDAEEAADVGLVEEVHDEDAFDERVYDFAETVAAKSPIALELAKEAVRSGSRMGRREGLDYEAELFTSLFDTADLQGGLDAFFEGREPEFRGE